MRLHVDLNTLIAQVYPWDFSLTVGEQTLHVRRLTNADIKQLQQVCEEDAVRELLTGWLSTNSDGITTPDLSRLDSDALGAIVAAVSAYYAGIAKKKAERVQRAVAAQMASIRSTS